MRFINEDQKKKWYLACQLKCKADSEKGFKAVQENKQLCTAKFVDCSANGGYDPRDPCKQKCVTPLEGRAQSAADTSASEVNGNTKFVIKNGIKIGVVCRPALDAEGFVCKDVMGDVVKLENRTPEQMNAAVTNLKAPPPGK